MATATAEAVLSKQPKLSVVSPPVLRRSLSKLDQTEMGVQAVPGANVKLPSTCFQISHLDDFPPAMELGLFHQNAKLTPVDPDKLCTDTQWEVGKDGELPLSMMSFMANGNLIPVSFKQQVLQVENVARQQQEQHNQVRHMAGDMGPLAGFFGLEVQANQVFFILEVRRDHLLRDVVIALQGLDPNKLRQPLKVKFAGEEGVDEGGVAREFFRLLSAQLFSPEYGMFKVDAESRYIWFDPGSFSELEDFWAVGVVVGLAVYNNIPGLDINFPLSLFKKLKGEPVEMEDFKRVFPSHAASLQALLDWIPPEGLSTSEADQLFEDTFCIDFSVSYDVLGETKTVGLIEGADPYPAVTMSRRAEFAQLFMGWYLTQGIAKQYESFSKGFSRVCGSPVFKCLSAAELCAIVSGEKDLDFAALRKGSQVVDPQVPFREGYLDDFWEVLNGLDSMQKRQFLNFATGSDLAPLGGLERLHLKIQRNGAEPTQQLPTSHTCFNLIALPEYSDKEKLKRLLICAIENAEGFGLE